MWKSSQKTWARLHEEAWRYFGGACRYVVLDNLKEGVIKPDLYEPQLNAVYGATLKHYGVVGDPARVRDPNRKGTSGAQPYPAHRQTPPCGFHQHANGVHYAAWTAAPDLEWLEPGFLS